ncbi:alpha/beta hydrolase [Neoroseomonas oryzicola]|uniref:Alpha/beta hydrolase n=1 Tax=Neoroseomonas oryzicola TaxID=535904 RepID=A0A9X9WCN5_9PROT|nr:alpha/beta hydrolase [Neoroseomonas oryzicola]MBR0658095.1 alpha/beta hydrolase [Neoroseomonas oryzicola]NKE15376.1 alpha/beta hydrolase [Neoroseomonas oryzicola]
MRRRAVILGALAAPGLARAAGIGAGSGRVEVAEATGATPAPMPVWYHRPASWTPSGKVAVVLHGLRRDADRYRDEWRDLADRHGVLLLVPEFGQDKFPGTRWYNFGNLQDDAGRATPSAAWSFHAFDRVVLAAMAMAGAQRDAFILYGHSAGAQFTHRYTLLTGAPRAEAVMIANAGSYTLPRFDRPFPEGLGGTAADPAVLRAVFARPVLLQLGEADTDPNHPSLPRQPWAIAQGSHRFARGWHFFDQARRAALEAGAPFAWRVVTVPGVGHSNAGMAEAAAPILFG